MVGPCSSEEIKRSREGIKCSVPKDGLTGGNATVCDLRGDDKFIEISNSVIDFIIYIDDIFNDILNDVMIDMNDVMIDMNDDDE